MIYIDFVPGSHGNFLEFVLNKLVAGNKIEIDTPFNSNGASHNKQINSYRNNMLFTNGHFSSRAAVDKPQDFNNIICVDFSADDLLALMTVSLRRAGDGNLDDNDLEVNTYFKLTGTYYEDVCDNLRETYSRSAIDSYNNIRGHDWPDLVNPEDFFQLPEHIQHECISDFNLKVCPLTKDYPDMDRNLLREFFKHGFKDTGTNGFMLKKNLMTYTPDQKVCTISYSSFYDTDKFLLELEKIKVFFGVQFVDIDIRKLHSQFLDLQFQKDYKKQCDEIVQLIIEQKDVILPTLTLFMESYINAAIELQTGKQLPIGNNRYFQTTGEIVRLLNEI